MASILSLEEDDGSPAEAGFFTWEFSEELVYADAALATLFGLDPDETEHGLPLETYLRQVHPDDRTRLMSSIKQTIAAQLPQQEVYRVNAANGQYVTVAAYGHCFRNRRDEPVHYVGIVVPYLVDGTSHSG